MAITRGVQLAATVAVLHFVTANPAIGQWVPCGAPLSRAISAQDAPHAASDGAGGAFVVWRDERDYYVTDSDIYAQYVLHDGRLAPGWPMDGMPICTDPAYQDHQQVIADGTGGAYFAWIDARDYWTGGRRIDIYLQRLTASGAIAAGWGVNGNPVCIATGDQYSPKLVLDAEGSVFVVWEDHRRDIGDSYVQVDIYVQKMTATGTIAPGWPTEGRAACLAPGARIGANAITDGSGGLFIAWTDGRSSSINADIYAIRLDTDGAIVPGWVEDGIGVCTAPNHQAGSNLVLDGEGGCVLAWQDLRTAPPSDPENDFYADVYAQRITGMGTVFSGWPENGLALCTAPGLQQDLETTPDGTGGAFVAWSDYRNYDESAADLYVQRVMGSGAIAPSWPVDGIRLSGAPGWQSQAAMVEDGSGGAWIAYSTSDGLDYELYLEHLTETGSLALGWNPDIPICTEPNVLRWQPAVVSDLAGGMIVVWEDGPGSNIYAQHVTDDYPTPVRLSLASARAEPDRVVLVWYGSEPRSASVQRRTEDCDWVTLGAPRRTGTGRLEYEDRSVNAGRYAYRLAYRTSDGEDFTPEAWVTVPGAHTISLAGFTPNPVFGRAVVSFTLASTERATLEVFDAAGRAVLEREVGSLGPGRHTLQIGRETSLAPGVYWLRLTQRERTLATKGLVVR